MAAAGRRDGSSSVSRGRRRSARRSPSQSRSKSGPPRGRRSRSSRTPPRGRRSRSSRTPPRNGRRRSRSSRSPPRNRRRPSSSSSRTRRRGGRRGRSASSSSGSRRRLRSSSRRRSRSSRSPPRNRRRSSRRRSSESRSRSQSDDSDAEAVLRKWQKFKKKPVKEYSQLRSEFEAAAKKHKVSAAQLCGEIIYSESRKDYLDTRDDLVDLARKVSEKEGIQGGGKRHLSNVRRQVNRKAKLMDLFQKDLVHQTQMMVETRRKATQREQEVRGDESAVLKVRGEIDALRAKLEAVRSGKSGSRSSSRSTRRRRESSDSRSAKLRITGR
eukprot:TRINITY_DN6243_c1_g1_i1.p1 TRINITY_DN6243_c1_g1~~TRINITY_DN6243_c1_g1_i1.p1  ORF type:complete len:327 (+),score=27.69 TRINITY_DN6243_c1_g1_i1:186-1166(+)